MIFSKEARIGLLATASIVILFLGFYFLKGANILSGEDTFYAYYENVQGLQNSSPVQIKGMSVGRVAEVSLTSGDKVKVTLEINNDIRLPEGTVAKLVTTDLLGSRAISLEPGNSTVFLDDETTLPSEIEGGIIDAISVEITPLLRDMRHAIGTLDSVLLSINTVLDDQAKVNLHNSLVNLNVTMEQFSQLSVRLNAQSQSMQQIIQNTEHITSNLEANSGRISNIIAYTETFSGKLANAPVETAIEDLQATLGQLKQITTAINANQGSLGMLVHDKELYDNLNASLQALEGLMKDIQAHPTKYINVTIFGRKKP